MLKGLPVKPTVLGRRPAHIRFDLVDAQERRIPTLNAPVHELLPRAGVNSSSIANAGYNLSVKGVIEKNAIGGDAAAARDQGDWAPPMPQNARTPCWRLNKQIYK